MYHDGPQGMGAKKLIRDEDGRLTLHQARPSGADTPCVYCPKIPKGAVPCPENAIEPSELSLAVLRWWKEAKAVGYTKRERKDPICRRNASLLDGIADAHERAPLTQLVSLLRLTLFKS